MRRAEAVQVRGVRELALGEDREVANANVLAFWKLLYLPGLPPIGSKVVIRDPATPLGLALEVEDVRPCEMRFVDMDIISPGAPGAPAIVTHDAQSAEPAYEVAFAREYGSSVRSAAAAGWTRVMPPPSPPRPGQRPAERTSGDAPDQAAVPGAVADGDYDWGGPGPLEPAVSTRIRRKKK